MFVDPYLGPEVYNEAYYRGEGPDPFVNYESEYNNYNATDRTLEFEDLLRVATELLKTSRHPLAEIEWLDFGCGSGGFLKYLRYVGTLHFDQRKYSLNLSGHDVGAWADRLKSTDKFDILDATALGSLPDACFDVISMIEVIEHMPYPGEAIALAHRLLKPGGILLLTTGNLSCPVARRQGLHYRYCMSEIHISLLNPSCLELLYRKSGLRPIAVRYKGVVAFKIVKSVMGDWKKSLARLCVKLPLLLRIVDAAYGVSQMPCAIKPHTGASESGN